MSCAAPCCSPYRGHRARRTYLGPGGTWSCWTRNRISTNSHGRPSSNCNRRGSCPLHTGTTYSVAWTPKRRFIRNWVASSASFHTISQGSLWCSSIHRRPSALPRTRSHFERPSSYYDTGRHTPCKTYLYIQTRIEISHSRLSQSDFSPSSGRLGLTNHLAFSKTLTEATNQLPLRAGVYNNSQTIHNSYMRVCVLISF